jgi:hypothetical protein
MAPLPDPELSALERDGAGFGLASRKAPGGRAAGFFDSTSVAAAPTLPSIVGPTPRPIP